MPEAVWHQSGLDPYRKSRLTTLAIQGQGWFSKVLKPSSGFQLMLLSILLWGANYGRLINTPPSPKINVEKVALSGEEIKLTLSLKDERYHYRGFLPLQFRLAGPQGTVISRFPESVKIPDTDRDLRFGLPKSAEETRLEVKFISSKDAADTKQLQDLYLWYAGTKVALLDMNKAVMRN
ncbi:MAG: hypothetical protein DCC75_14285 [Proteobacteria bacterium]|nr:MAG: hypothetical protein DCC75_14285 [Pseudomonadota bacterium]